MTATQGHKYRGTDIDTGVERDRDRSRGRDMAGTETEKRWTDIQTYI